MTKYKGVQFVSDISKWLLQDIYVSSGCPCILESISYRWISAVMHPNVMMTSSNGNISSLLAICAGNSPVPGEFPTQRPVTRSFDVFFDLGLNDRLSKQSWGWWLETLSCPLWRHPNVLFTCQQVLMQDKLPCKFEMCNISFKIIMTTTAHMIACYRRPSANMTSRETIVMVWGIVWDTGRCQVIMARRKSRSILMDRKYPRSMMQVEQEHYELTSPWNEWIQECFWNIY